MIDDSDIRRCELTNQICDKDIVACRSCLVPFYMWMLENEVRE